MEFKRTSDGRVFFSNLGNNSYDNDTHSNTNYSSEPVLKSPLTGKILTPEQRDRAHARASAMDQAPSQYQILSVLKSLNEKLKITQVERNSMRQELKAYRHMISSLEKKASETEQAHAELENKLKASTNSQPEIPQTILNELKETKNLYQKLENRTERNDRHLADLEEKAKAHKEASLTLSKKQAELDRLSSSYTQLNGRLEQAEKNYQNLSRSIATQSPQGQDKLMEIILQDREDRARFMRKMERLEKTVLMLADERSAAPQLEAKQAGDIKATLTDQAQHEANAPRFMLKNKNKAAEKASAEWVKSLAQQINNPWQSLVEKKVPQITLGLCLLVGASALVINSGLPDKIQNYIEQRRLNAVAEKIENIYTPPVTHNEQKPSTSLEQQKPYEAAKSWDVSKDISKFMIKPDAPNPNIPTPAQQQQLSETMDADAAAVAAALNQIEPGSITAPAIDMPDSIKDTQNAKPSKKSGAIGKADPMLPQSLQHLESLALNGDHNAQHDLGALYVIGQNGVTQDYKRAAYWFDKAAQGGVANATYNMGVLYHQGLGVKQNTQQAVAWYKAAADQGHPEAAYNLASPISKASALITTLTKPHCTLNKPHYQAQLKPLII